MSDPTPDNISVDLSGVINLPTATEDRDGLVELADAAETQAGVDDTQAVTPASAAATYIPLSALSAKGDLLTLSGCNMRVALRVGTDGQVLTACSGSATGLCWASLPPTPPPSIPCSCLTAKGALVTASAPSTPSALPVGADGQVLTASSASATGLCWTTPSSPAIPCACIVGKGALVTGTAPNTPSALPVGSDGQVLTACSTAPSGLCWVASASTSIPCACITGKGVILTGTAASSPSALPVGADGQILMACSTAPSGLCWATSSTAAIPCSCITGKGALVTGATEGTPIALALGSQGQLLKVNTQCCTGLEWSNVGKTASMVLGAGVAMGMDNLRVCFTRTGNRTWAFATASGTETAIVQTTSATGTALATAQRTATLNSTTYTELGWSFTCAASCATYLICLGPLNAPNSIYCFVGMVGCSYNANFFHLTRLF